MCPPEPPRGLRARAIVLTLTALCVLVLLPSAGKAAGRSEDRELQQALHELRETKQKIRERAQRLRELGREMNQLATEISNDEAQVNEATQRIGVLEDAIAVLEVRSGRLQDKLSERNRAAFILGPGVPVIYLLTATSAADAAARMSILTEMNRRDDVLATQVQNNDGRLDRGRAEFARMQRVRELGLQQLAVDRAELRDHLVESHRLFDLLRAHKEDVLYTISRYRPFAVCPVAGPVAIADDFGIWVHRTEKMGGDHIHQGNDMMAAMGTPIVAPFDGVAVASPNRIGGLAVKVFGDFGYVYNAHLSRFGQLGPVQAGDVVGYVGATGNTNAPHDHFEWHPGDGPAVDPHEFLLKVC